MSNTIKSLIFILSMFAFFLYFFVTSTFITALIGMLPPSTYAYIFSINMVMGFLAILFTQALIKYIHVKRALKDASIVQAISITPFRFVDRVLIYTLPAIMILFPIISKRAFNYNSFVAVLSLIGFILVLEVIFLFSQRTMKVYVTNKGIAIKGLDLRLETPIPSTYPNNSGFYTFDRLEAFLVLNDSIQLFHSYDLGVITIPCEGDTLKQIKGLLLFNKVPDKRF